MALRRNLGGWARWPAQVKRSATWCTEWRSARSTRSDWLGYPNACAAAAPDSPQAPHKRRPESRALTSTPASRSSAITFAILEHHLSRRGLLSRRELLSRRGFVPTLGA